MRRASGRRTIAAAMAALAVLTGASTPALARWSVEARLGNAWNAPLAMRIRQPGEPTLDFDPRWSTRGFEFPLYYGVRIGRGAWALDLVHHKLHLEDPPAEIRKLAISHGYNLLTLQRLSERGRWFWGGGAGLVVAHPEGEIRGRRIDEHRGLLREGYFAAGPAFAALGGYSIGIGSAWRIAAEARLTFTHAEMPVPGGYARVPNLAGHGTLGLGWSRR